MLVRRVAEQRSEAGPDWLGQVAWSGEISKDKKSERQKQALQGANSARSCSAPA
ncbi:hypothetical protein XMIN_2246 [Xanthomonas citri pv. mangiferaeindicae LMG 941]|nr:hypothetical protein XAPC_3283 [Xanthomonas citri pv. punicae str. LMG 859]CCG37266.1 hypothetical protein XMIN_2246 [Xanthomonas citri pv. mangiferaeindicae LMG 941]